MFEETQFREMPASLEAVSGATAPALWNAAGLTTTPVGPGAFRAVGAPDSYGVAPEVLVQLQPGPQGTQVQIRYGAALSQNGTIALVALVIFMWPLAALLAWLAYSDFTRRRQSSFPVLWHALTPPGLPAYQPPHPGYRPG